MKKLLILLFLSALLLGGCAATAEPEMYILPANRVGDHLSPTQLGRLARDEGRLALRGSDLNGVDWEHQEFSVKPELVPSVSTISPQGGGCSLLKTTDKDVFVWVQGNQALYVGGFPMGISNPSPPRQTCLRDKERYVFTITSTATNDPRFQKSMYRWFSARGLIKSTLSN